MGTGSIRDSEKKPTGLRFVQWIHHDSREAARADPRPESTRAVYLLARAAETFETGKPDVQAETATFLKATESHSSWHPPCLAEHYNGKVRRLRSVLTTQSCLSQGEQNQLNQLLSQTHPLHGSGLLFGCAANKARLYHFEALHKIHFYDAWRSEPVLIEKTPPCSCPRHQAPQRNLLPLTRLLATRPQNAWAFPVLVHLLASSHRLTASTACETLQQSSLGQQSGRSGKLPDAGF